MKIDLLLQFDIRCAFQEILIYYIEHHVIKNRKSIYI